MKFAVIALLATVSAQTVCTDDDAADVCVEDGACCGYLTPAEGDASRGCGDGTGAAAVEYDGEDVFACEAPVAAEDGTFWVLGLISLRKLHGVKR